MSSFLSFSNTLSADGESLDRELSSPRTSSTLIRADNSSMERGGSPISISSRSHLVNHGNSSFDGKIRTKKVHIYDEIT